MRGLVLSRRDVQVLLAGAVLGFAAMAPVIGWTPAEAAMPSIIRDECKGMSGGDGGLQCPSSDYLLIRYKDIWGNCGAWMCCPPNGNGTYDCGRSTNPTRVSVRDRYRAPRATTLDPGRKPPTPSGITIQGKTLKSAPGFVLVRGSGNKVSARRAGGGGFGATAECSCNGGTGSCDIYYEGSVATCTTAPHNACNNCAWKPAPPSTAIR